MSTNSKGDILESITEILERSLSDESTVITKKKKIEDLDGIVREIDIYIETIVNKRKFSIAIECKNYKEESRIDMDKIGAFYEKCERLPFINKMIFLTTSDYQKGAIKKARTRNIELYRISQELLEDKSQLGIDKVSIIEKKCKILAVRFNSEKLLKNRIFTNEKFEFYSDDKKLIKHEDFLQKIIELPGIWRFLFTKSGVLLNQKKRIYPNLNTKNIYTNYRGNYYPVELMQFTLEIEYLFNPLEISNIKKYQSLTENTTLALFSDLEFVANGIKHRFCYVKPTDENIGRFFISTSNEKESVELKTLGKLALEPKPKSKLRNIQVLPYEFKISKHTVNNLNLNNQTAPIEENSRFLKELKSKKSSALIGLDEHKRKLFIMIPFSHNKKLITAKFPEPISLFFNHAIELHLKSMSYKSIMVSHSTDDESILLQDDSYHKFLQYGVSSIFMLHSAIELFINSCIKDNFKFDLYGKFLNKKELEEQLTLNEKLEKIIPQIRNFKLNSNKRIVRNIIDLNELNEELQNLKTSETVNQPFLDTFERLIKFNMEDCFESTKNLFKKVNKNFRLIEL